MKHIHLPLRGQCLCGAVHVTVAKAPLLTLACHCRGCQKLTASAFSLTTMVPSDAFTCTGDVIQGGLKSRGREHYYCASCLNFVFSKIEGADHRINLRTSILDAAAAFEPFVEVFTDEKMPWAQTSAKHSYAQAPASLDEVQKLMDAYADECSRD